jgi:hypothetical protein
VLTPLPEVKHVYGNLGSEEQDLVPELQYAKLK